MPIKFSQLKTMSTPEEVGSVTKLVGLYADSGSGTNLSNCLIDVSKFAKKAELDTINNSVVHISGTESIIGSKTFENTTNFRRETTFTASPTIKFNNPGINLKADNITKGVTPSQFSAIQLKFFDKNSKVLSYVEGAYSTSGQKYISLVARDGTTEGTSATSMGIGYDSANIVYTWAPKPSANSNDNNIATTNWIRTLFSTMYPVGSVYIGTNKTCPMASIIPGSTWTLVAANKALWTGSGNNGNTTIEAGLPNITGGADVAQGQGYDYRATGAFTKVSGSGGNWDTGANCRLDFNASRSSPIYGNSDTVQPPAYVVNVWRRTA